MNLTKSPVTRKLNNHGLYEGKIVALQQGPSLVVHNLRLYPGCLGGRCGRVPRSRLPFRSSTARSSLGYSVFKEGFNIPILTEQFD